MRILLLISLLLGTALNIVNCQRTVAPPCPEIHRIPGNYVYSIIEHGDSLYFSTQRGEVFRFSPENPDSLTRMGLPHFRPLRTLLFGNDDILYASSYETGVQIVKEDTLIPVPQLWQNSWAMKKDPFGTIWLAGRQGVFKDGGDTLIRKTALHDANDVDFYNGHLVVAHRRGVTFFDTCTGKPDTTFCPGTIFWSIDIFDSLLVAGGVERCALIRGHHCRVLTLKPHYTIPWSAARDRSGTIYLATQKGLFSLNTATLKTHVIAYKDSCVKSVFVDSDNRLWIGEYFRKQ